MSETFNIMRAVSPGLATSIAAATTTEVDQLARTRRRALQLTSTVDELVGSIPHAYRDLLRPRLYEVASIVRKRDAAQKAVDKLTEHVAKGTWPPHLRHELTTAQLSSSFASTSLATENVTAAKEAFNKWRADQLSRDLTAKKLDVEHLNNQLKPEALFNSLAQAVSHRCDALVKRAQLPVWGTGQEGGLVLLKWAADPSIIELGEEVKNDLMLYVARVVSIVESSGAEEAAKLAKKKQLQKDADVEMADLTMDRSSIQSHIDKAVNRALKSKLAKDKVSEFIQGSSSDAYQSPLFRSSEDVGLGEEGERQKEVDRWFEEEQSHRPRKARKREGQSFSQARRQVDQDVQGQIRSQGRQEQTRMNTASTSSASIVGRSAAAAPNLNSYVYGIFSTIPDWLLTIPYPRAISYLILNTPLDIVTASRFKSNVHLSPDVTVPLEYQHQLSVGMRYMLPTPRNKLLIQQAWRDLDRRIRWRLLFSFKGEEEDYDPDYETDRPTSERKPRMPEYIERGLVAGKIFVTKTISKIPDEESKDHLKSLIPKTSHIRKFLAENDYIVTGTDKNLGLAVSKRTWVQEKCLDLLNDTNNYERINEETANRIFDRQCAEMERISDLVKASSIPFNKQLVGFLRSQVSEHQRGPKGERVYINKPPHKAPVFYGIPKIHKEPVKMRPIIPCHSAIQNPAAKFISKQLKPLIQGASTIIHGTKDLAKKLSEINIDRNRRWFIVTGDVVAYYPNIPLDKALQVVYDLWRFWRWPIDSQAWVPAHAFARDAIPTRLRNASDQRELEIFWAALKVANRDLVCQYGNAFFRQLNGLAMGVADSPDIANLFGYWHEFTQCRITDTEKYPQVIIYGRYIDDCFSLVYGESEQAVLEFMKNTVRIEGCEIEWNVSEQYAPFLDMTVYKDHQNRLQHMPYRKARNHMERIPWISAHPQDVKRGTFIGEMSRLATLSSTLETYHDALRGLASLYIARGYPERLVSKWLKDNVADRWQKRLDNVSQNDTHDVLVLKTTYNTAWNYFSARELGETVIGTWRNEIELSTTRVMEGTLNWDASLNIVRGKSDWAELKDCNPRFLTEMWTEDLGPTHMPDLTKLGFLDRRMIVSRKRTRNLFDLTSLWKKTVLSRMEEDLSDPMTVDEQGDEDVVMENTAELSDDEDNELLNRRWSPTRQLGYIDPSTFLRHQL